MDPVIIVGGGIGGLAAALALALHGRASLVLEQAAEFREVGAGIQLGPNVFRRFDRLGVRAAIDAVAVFPEALIMRDALDGHEITRLPLGERFAARFGQPYAVIHRADLLQALLAACRAQPLIELRTKARMAAFEDAADHVLVRLEGGETHRGSLLIGADGLWSRVREHVVGDGAPLVSGHIAYRAVLPTEAVPVEQRETNVVLWAGPRTHLVHYPLRRGELYNLVAVFHSDRYSEGWDAHGDTEELYRRFAGQRPEVLRLLDKIESWRMWVLCDREPVRNWSRGRVVLLGDAAHPMLQYLAQGACMAIEDALCLAESLDRHGPDHAAAFAAYQQARYLRTGRVQATARIYGQIYHAANVVAELRDQMLRGRTPEQAYAGMAWLYDG
jgi:2-polyprenyl-6-methoxyphenol hydroxylase-like FAD-dependent oxidoreductase